jgi:hypothetical protein
MKLFHFTIEDTCDTDNFIILADTEQQGRQMILTEYIIKNKNKIRVENVVDLSEPILFASISQSWD